MQMTGASNALIGVIEVKVLEVERDWLHCVPLSNSCEDASAPRPPARFIAPCYNATAVATPAARN